MNDIVLFVLLLLIGFVGFGIFLVIDWMLAVIKLLKRTYFSWELPRKEKWRLIKWAMLSSIEFVGVVVYLVAAALLIVALLIMLICR